MRPPTCRMSRPSGGGTSGLLEQREPFRDFVYRILLRDGSHGFVSSSGQPLFDSSGSFLGYRGVGRDVTATTRAEQALRDAKLQAEAASRAKSEFLANMSHELRTPLNAIIGFSEMIKSEILGPVDHEQYRTYAGDINSSGLHLLGIINEILDLAKVEAGKMDLDLRLLNLTEIAKDVLRILQTQADAMGLTLEVAIAPKPAAGACRRAGVPAHPVQPAVERLQVHAERRPDHGQPAADRRQATSSCRSPTPASASRRRTSRS